MVKKKKTGLIITITVIVLAVVAALLFLFRNRLFCNIGHFNVTTFNSDIVIKRSDAQEPLNMPYRYSKALLDKRLVFREEIERLNITTVRYEISKTGLALYNCKEVLKNPESGETKKVIESIKYCKGITALSGLKADKADSKITIYRGYSADLLEQSLHNYVIIPSTLSEHIDSQLSDNEKVLFLVNSGTSGLAYFTIIGEYETKHKHDTLYFSYSGLSNVVLGGKEDIVGHIDYMGIDINDKANLVKFSYFLSEYFADYNVLSQYEKRINKFNEPYQYMYVNNVDILPINLSEDSGFEKNIITVTGIDGNDNLQMSHVYGDALIEDYHKYSQYITDIIISTGVKGEDWSKYPLNVKIPCYGINFGGYGLEGFYVKYTEYYQSHGMDSPWYHQAVTSVREIKSMKKNCDITFYTNYTEKDLVVIRKEDYVEPKDHLDSGITGYAIVPKMIWESVRNHPDIDYQIIRLFEQPKKDDNPSDRMRFGFKVIGYYETADESDTVYVTYGGYNRKYVKEPFKNECIRSMIIETRSDADITPLLEYLEQYFAPATDTSKYAGKKNLLGMEYEYCYTITSEQ